MGIFISLLVVVHVIVCFLLVLLVLMQRPKQEGLGAAFGGGVTDQMFGAQTTDVLQKGTVWLTVAFFVISMLLAILMANRNDLGTGLTETLGEGAAAPIEKKTGDGLPALPKPPEGLTPAVPVEPAKAATSAAAAKKEAAARKDATPVKKDAGAAANTPAAPKPAAGAKKAEPKAKPAPVPAPAN